MQIKLHFFDLYEAGSFRCSLIKHIIEELTVKKKENFIISFLIVELCLYSNLLVKY